MRFIKIFYYSFVISFVGVTTLSLVWMFFTKTGVVTIQEPIIAVRVTEIIIGIILVGMTVKYMITDILDSSKIRRRIEIDSDKESNTFWVTDPNIDYWSSFPMGDIILDMDKQGKLKGFEILNAGKLNIDMKEHDKITKELEKAEKEKGVKE